MLLPRKEDFAGLLRIELMLALLLLSAQPSAAGEWFAAAAVAAQGAPQLDVAPASTDVEQRVILKLSSLIRPGQPLVVSRLYNEVFTDPSERKVLDRLFNLFFKIPIYLVQEFETRGKPPSLQELSQQFHLVIPGEAQLLVTIMEADPRVPKFFRRDAASGEILSVDPAALRANPRFAAQLERSLTGLEGKAAPDFNLAEIDGSQLSLSSLRGRTVLLDFWFTNCPPCGQISAHLVTLQQKYGGDKFTVLGLNCDRILE
ncbi:MAG TPA: TlpA disulfide reductase family protein, partial [Acidobacteriota bacterium]|nr:TlpA disulfide reductase family protein [Acidobacteriota bacterium]